MQHRRALGISIILTLAIVFTVLVSREQFLTSSEADATNGNTAAVSTTTPTQMPLVNLVKTADGQTVAIPADSQTVNTGNAYNDDDSYEHESDHNGYDNDEHEGEYDD